MSTPINPDLSSGEPRRYRKKPVVIDAFRFDGSFPLEFLGDHDKVYSASPGGGAVIVSTLEGEMRCEVGDWLIRGVKGELYPCKNDIFQATYELVEDR